MAGKLILVTGGAGLIGSNLIKRLVAEGHRVISLDNYFAGTKDAHVDGAEYREGHTKDIAQHVPETPDLIYHLGEYSRVEQSVLEPDVVQDLNVVGTAAVIDYWKDRKCKLVYAGSSTKFGDGGAARHTSPYAASKAANTELVKEVGDREKLPYAITYFYNVFGPGERYGVYGTVIESFKQMYLRGTPLTVVAPGTQQRNFTHVDDIVDGLIVVGERGEGDEFGLGNERALSLMEIAQLFGGEIMMMPERAGNRMQSGLDTSKAQSLGWKATRSVEEYIRAFIAAHPRGAPLEKRVLVFSTTFHPIAGPAEEALCDLMASMPDVQFDVVTALFSPDAKTAACPVPNARVHHVGWGRSFDKYLLPILGLWRAHQLHRQHSYLFAWALMASYAALAGALLKRATEMPLLITLADQDLARVSWWKRAILPVVLTDADQVYGGDVQEKAASELASRDSLRRSMGDGDAFANAIRFAYSGLLRKRL
jgi:UDP-glucose 4-epimerase